MDYFDFDLHLSRTAGGYRARATNAQGATAHTDFVLPFTDDQIKILFLSIGRPRHSVKRHIRQSDSPEMQTAKAFGGKLFDAVLAGEVFGLWRSSFHAANAQGKGLRLRLRLSDTPELADLPWEFLYDNARNQFVALLTKTPVVRFLDLPTPIQPLQTSLPLRVLVVISDPTDYDALDVEREWANVRKATENLEMRGAVTVTRLPHATLAELRRTLRQTEYHVLHFIGHGAFMAQEQDGVLIFKNEQGRGQRVSSQMLAQVLANFDSLRLVILNACEGARTSRNDPFAGIAPSLVQQDKPAVIAMQFEVSDSAAVTFADEFYSALADGYAVDAALTHARTAILTDVNDLEWGTPVLYMRAPNGIIFDLTNAPPKPEPAKPVAPLKSALPEIKLGSGVSIPSKNSENVQPPPAAPPKAELPEIKLGGGVSIPSRKPETVKVPPLILRRTNKAGQEMILIPAGEFLMGTTDAQAKRLIQEYGKDWEKLVRWEQPQHQVHLDAFYISRYPVTNAEYKKFKPDWKIPNGKENHLVVNVNWEDAKNYCEWVGGRLPTEAEWEKAASWDEANQVKRIYPWGDAFDKNKCNSLESGIGDTTPVGKYSPQGDSFYGVGDMTGNVWDWCADWFDEKYYASSPRENPQGPASGSSRVLRGGSFVNAASDARCAWRGRYGPSFVRRLFGFRVVAAPVRL